MAPRSSGTKPRPDTLFARQARHRLMRAIWLLHGASSDIHTADPRGSRPVLRSAAERVHEALQLLKEANDLLIAESR